jgi:hypothetical protein
MCDKLAKGVRVGWCDVPVALGRAERGFFAERGERIGLTEPSGITERKCSGYMSTSEVGVELVASKAHVPSMAPPDAARNIGVPLVEYDEANDSHGGCGGVQDEQAAFGCRDACTAQLNGLATVQDRFGEPRLNRYQQGPLLAQSVAEVAVGCAHAREL